MFKIVAILGITLFQLLVVAPSVASDRKCTPEIAWSDVPSEIRAHLVEAVDGEISPQGGPFNSTDIIIDSTPRARFFGACSESDGWAVAIERGGIGYHMQVFTFAGETLTDKWTAFVPSGGFTPSALVKPAER
ncbi:hypothetical protein [Arenimonas daejeonensis]|uniref:hypothetical protein n=1 Tax=Arenimonas daejeonensis TaxID=370777 RepID=UPI0011BE899F|nr:hypothetical protein [Arenimonas daejeonensis]